MNYKFEFKITEQDYLDFNKYHMFNAPAMKKQMLPFRLIIPILFVFISFFQFQGFDSDFIRRTTIGIIGSIAWFFISKFTFISSIKKNIKNMKKDGKLVSNENTTIQFHDDFLIDITGATETKMGYTNLERVAIGDNAVYIYIGAMQAFIVPLSAFESEAQRNEFLEFINSKIRYQK